MVWILMPNHPSLGASKYYFTMPGTYKVGRKDCAVIIQTDKTVSRLHAEIIIDSVNTRDDPCDVTHFPKPRIVLRDLSKFGSFVNRIAGSKPVFSLPNKERDLNEGDLVVFGTDNSSFRLEYLSLLPYITPLVDESRRDAIVRTVASVGGYAVDKWCPECSHLIVEDGSYVTEAVIQAVANKKPVIGIAWIEAVSARTSLSAEFPSFSRFTPNLLWKIDNDEKFLKIIEPEARLAAFKGFTFYVGSMYLYNHKDLLRLLAEASGGNIQSVTDVSRSRAPTCPQQNPTEILILPTLEPELQRWMSPEELRSISHVRKMTEEKFIAAVLSGDLKEDDYFEVPASPAASASSDETVEASHSPSHEDEINSSVGIIAQPSFAGKDLKWNVSLPEQYTSRSIQSSTVVTPQPKASAIQRERSRTGLLRSNNKHVHEASSVAQQAPTSMDKFKGVHKALTSSSTSHSQAISGSANVAGSAHASTRITLEDQGVAKADVEFRKNLVVRTSADSLNEDCSTDLLLQNFKRFRKKPGSSGNSFAALVPFAKEPYRESDFNKEVKEYMEQEKKRKRAEALAEDLFNAEQLKRKKGVGASLVSAVREGRVKGK